MRARDETLMATTEMGIVWWALGVSLPRHRRNGEISEDTKLEPFPVGMRRKGSGERRQETEQRS